MLKIRIWSRMLPAHSQRLRRAAKFRPCVFTFLGSRSKPLVRPAELLLPDFDLTRWDLMSLTAQVCSHLIQRSGIRGWLR